MKKSDPLDRLAPESERQESTKTVAEESCFGLLPAEDSAAMTEEVPMRKGDQRTTSRYSFSASAEAFEPRTRTRISGRLADLSVGGCYIDTVSPFPVGTAIRLRLASEGRALQVAAVVTYAVHGMGMGLAFTRMSPEQANILSAWLADLSGDRPFEWEADEPQPPPAPAFDLGDSLRLRDAARELVELLRKKSILSEAEFLALQKKMSG